MCAGAARCRASVGLLPGAPHSPAASHTRHSLLLPRPMPTLAVRACKCWGERPAAGAPSFPSDDFTLAPQPLAWNRTKSNLVITELSTMLMRGRIPLPGDDRVQCHAATRIHTISPDRCRPCRAQADRGLHRLLPHRPGPGPPWRQPRGKSMVSSVNSHTNATSRRWHLWEIDLIFAHGLPPGWRPG